MGTGFQDCIVAFVDLVGVKDLAQGSQASTIMRKFHNVVMQAMAGNSNDRLMRAYTWNDSVLLLAYVDKNRHDYESVLRQVDCLKQKIDSVRKSYAVVVKGQAFPPPEGQNTSPNGRFVFIEASSYAMANCMGIPKIFSRENRHQWYLDQRIESEISELLAQRASAKKCRFLPDEERLVFAYDKLWGEELIPAKGNHL